MVPAWHLVHVLQIDCLLGLDPHDKLVGAAWNQLVERLLFECDADLCHALVEALACSHEERHASPALVVDVQDDCGIRGALRTRGYSLVIQVSRLLVQLAVEVPRVARKLPDEAVLHAQLPHGLEELDLLLRDVLAGQLLGRLHGDPQKDLQQVVLHDIADDAKLVEVASTAASAKILLENNLYRSDVAPVPDCLKQLVPEADRRQVQNHLLAQVVVNPED
mmetsp:Transcript_47397/g.141467  ORF Transcript_47397/g.141467 Transcript_47397/m.141467 type:complete len:221 (-) Transcript_47397:379-1041(-)